MHDIFDSKFVNEEKLFLDTNEIEELKVTEESEKIISKALEPVKIKEPEFDFF